jgi:hypothetical protein
MLAKGVLCQIVDDEALTRGLEEPEARILIEWLVEQVEEFAESEPNDAALATWVIRLVRRARSGVRFVRLWCYERDRRAAIQLAGTERFGWPLPTERGVDPCELMNEILDWEAEELARK